MHHELHPVDVGVGLGSHDPGVAIHISTLYHRGYFPHIVFTGANAPTTIDPFPRGEAVHYRDNAIELGVPTEAILVDPYATNTSENIENTRTLLADSGITTHSLILVSRPYQQRRAYATAKKIWPEAEILCTARPLSLDEYVKTINDADKVINMLVGDTQRITVYAEKGFAIPQDVPENVQAAYQRLISVGFTSRLIS
jgi:uncharacterized SAM-binding protein YcdF (DUF218 family)